MLKIKLKKIIYICFIFILALSNINIAEPNDDIIWPKYQGELDSYSSIVVDANSDIVLFDKNSNAKTFPASLTKIMTAIVVLDNTENLEEMVTFTYNAVTKDIDRNSTTIGASAGDILSIKDCLYSLLLPSANDVANALAEHIAGSINDFVLLMNDKAKTLGMNDTNFINPSGLHNENQYTTASDMAKLYSYALKKPIYKQITSSLSYRHKPIRKYRNPNNSNNQVLNNNSMITPGSGFYYKWTNSGKTGHTSDAGFNLAVSAEKDNMQLICITLNSKNNAGRYNDAKKLFDFHFDNYKSLTIKNTDYRFKDVDYNLSIDNIVLVKSLDITTDEYYHVTLPKNVDFSDVRSEVSFTIINNVDNFVIGSVNYYLGEKNIGMCLIEGLNSEEDETIYTAYLDLSTALNTRNNSIPIVEKPANTKNKSLIFFDNQGRIVITKTLFTIIKFSSIVLFLFFTLLFIRTRLFTSIFELLKTAYYSIRQKMRLKRH